jgi:YD repeat-containing protein
MTLLGRAYGLEGRVTSETNALGSVTQFSQSYNGSGELVETSVSLETGADYTTRTAKDGSLLEVSGTAANHLKYYYGAEATGDFSPDGPSYAVYIQEVKVSSTGSETEWNKTYYSMLGIPYKRVYASASGTPTRQLYLNSKGQITKAKDPDGVQWLFQYDARGRLEYQVLDMNRDGVIDFNGTDRITQIQRSVLNDASLGSDVVREERYVWGTDNSSTSTKVSTVSASTAGTTAWSAIWNGASSATTKFQITYPTTGTTRLTETFPNLATQVIDSIADRVQSITDKNSSGTQITKTSYVYDAHGRAASVTDARDGTTTRTFNAADQVVSVTTPAPGGGGNAQTTTATYDGLGRIFRVQQPDGTYTTNLYTLKDELKQVSGAWTYPVGYGYDEQGRLTSMTNWSDFAGNTGARVTTWAYDTYRGFLTGKTYAGNAGPGYSYTAGGRLATRTWARGITTTYTPNNAGDLYTIAYSDGTPGVTTTYDRMGRVSTVVQNGITTTKSYNGASQLMSESYSGGILAGLSVANTYDTYLRRMTSQVTSYGGTINAYTYDTANRLATVGDGTNVATYTYLRIAR